MKLTSLEREFWCPYILWCSLKIKRVYYYWVSSAFIDFASTGEDEAFFMLLTSTSFHFSYNFLYFMLFLPLLSYQNLISSNHTFNWLKRPIVLMTKVLNYVTNFRSDYHNFLVCIDYRTSVKECNDCMVRKSSSY